MVMDIEYLMHTEHIDKVRSRRRYQAREAWRNSKNPAESGAVMLAEAGYGAEYIKAYTGISYKESIRLVTGE